MLTWRLRCYQTQLTSNTRRRRQTSWKHKQPIKTYSSKSKTLSSPRGSESPLHAGEAAEEAASADWWAGLAQSVAALWAPSGWWERGGPRPNCPLSWTPPPILCSSLWGLRQLLQSKTQTPEVEEGASSGPKTPTVQSCTRNLQLILPDHNWTDVFWCAAHLNDYVNTVFLFFITIYIVFCVYFFII